MSKQENKIVVNENEQIELVFKKENDFYGVVISVNVLEEIIREYLQKNAREQSSAKWNNNEKP